jgi:hypothetical protein
MAKIKLTGNKKALSDIRVQWEIARQLLQQRNEDQKTINVGKISGIIELGKDDKIYQVIDLLKAKSEEPTFKGEIEVFDTVVFKMNDIFNSQMLKMTNDLEKTLGVSGETLKKAYSEEWFIPPLTVAKEARRGLELRRKYKRGGLSNKQASELGIGSGVQRAVNLSNRDKMNPETIKRMVSFFARHKKHKDSMTKEGEPKAGKIAWLLWGGDAGEQWSNSVLDKMKEADLKKANERADTPAEPHERIRGSRVNEVGSAKNRSKAKKIVLDEKIIDSLKLKVKEHNTKFQEDWQKVNLADLKAVYRRGAGAFSDTHRPSQNRQSWAYARVNAFLDIVSGEGNKKYTQDDDLLHKEHPRKQA